MSCYRPLTLLTLTSLMLLSGAALAACDDADVRQQMTPDEFTAAGLDQLSSAQVDALNAWLARKLEVECEEARSEATAAAEARAEEAAEARRGLPEDDAPITGRIAGDFNGWTGKTRFTLDNGQVWQQTRGGTFRHKTIQNPAVEITPEFMGSWALRVEGVGRAVRVRRIK